MLNFCSLIHQAVLDGLAIDAAFKVKPSSPMKEAGQQTPLLLPLGQSVEMGTDFLCLAYGISFEFSSANHGRIALSHPLVSENCSDASFEYLAIR